MQKTITQDGGLHFALTRPASETRKRIERDLRRARFWSALADLAAKLARAPFDRLARSYMNRPKSAPVSRQ